MSGGGGTTQTTSQTNTDMGPWWDQQPYLRDVFGAASHNYHDKPALPSYPGATVSPFNPAQTQGYNTMAGMGTSPLLPASLTNATDTLNGKYLDPSTNPWLSKTFDAAAAPVTRAFQNSTAPTTDAMFSANGRYGGGARFNAQNNNTMGLGETLAKLGTGIYGGNYGQERANQVMTQGQVGQLESNRYIDPTAQVNAGGAIQGQAQKELSDKVQKFNFDQTSPWQTLAMYKGMIDGSYGQHGTTTSTQQQPYNSNTFGQILGGGMSLASTFAPFFLPMMSDVRAKENIHPVGKTNDGQNLYLYNYKGNPTPQVGLMAQEVEQRDPGAIVEHPSGLKMVDYARALGPSVFLPRGA